MAIPGEPRRRRSAAPVLVRHLMTSEVATLGPEDDVTRLYDLMEERHVRHVPVLDETGVLVGLVTHRDLLRSAISDHGDLPFSVQRDLMHTMRIEEIMTGDPETIEPDRDIREAALLMLENKYGCLPVVEGEKLVGILTESDFMRYVLRTAP